MIFQSILFERIDDSTEKETPEPPDCFGDLFLDQVINAITVGKQEYNLKPFFYTPLNDVNAIRYRHEVMRDLEEGTLLEDIKAFAEKMRSIRRILTLISNLHYKHNREGWFLEAVEIYGDAVKGLARDLTLADLQSRGLLAFREYITDYARSERFTSLMAETEELRADLATVKYCLTIKGSRVQVRRYESEVDYSADVQESFEKFKQGAVKDYRVELRTGAGMNHVEAKILELVARLYPDIFSNLNDYCAKNGDFLDETITVFDREIQFYIAYLGYMEGFKRARLGFCYPKISDTKEVYNYEGFDLALAYKLLAENSPVVCNDFHLKGRERMIVVSGPNQGGKTTFARTFGQLHYLASIGCPVPGSEAQLFLPDGIFTHFGKEERIEDHHGKLQDDLVRIHDILNRATSNSIVILNEIFTSTTLRDGIVLSKKVMEKLLQLDVLGVFVTFIVEMASLNEKTISMISTVVPDNPALRTYKIERRPADGLSYAISIARQHGLTYDGIKERIGS